MLQFGAIRESIASRGGIAQFGGHSLLVADSLSDDPVALLSARLDGALRSAHAAHRGVPPDLQPLTREHGKAWRLSGGDIASLLVNVKAMVRISTGADEPLFTPKIVGWTIAGFFAGTAPKRD